MATWVVGDIHGQFNTFQTLLKNPEIKDSDTIILIGDIIDRGPDSYKMLQWAMQNISPNGRYQMVCENHEDNILRDCLRLQNSWQNAPQAMDELPIDRLACQYDFVSYMKEAGYETVGSVAEILQWFVDLQLTKFVSTESGDYLIVHGWCAKETTREEILWGRDTDYYCRWLPDYEPVEGETLVHGHTPTFIQNGYPEHACVHFRAHSIDVDCGAAYPEYGGRLAAIRLDDRHIIYQNIV